MQWCGFIKPPGTNKEWLIQKHGVFEHDRTALGSPRRRIWTSPPNAFLKKFVPASRLCFSKRYSTVTFSAGAVRTQCFLQVEFTFFAST